MTEPHSQPDATICLHLVYTAPRIHNILGFAMPRPNGWKDALANHSAAIAREKRLAGATSLRPDSELVAEFLRERGATRCKPSRMLPSAWQQWERGQRRRRVQQRSPEDMEDTLVIDALEQLGR